MLFVDVVAVMVAFVRCGLGCDGGKRVKVPMRDGDATRQETGRYVGWKRWVFMFPGMLIVAMEVVSVASAVV